MNESYIILIIIIIILVLSLSFILISYFYNSYSNNKIVVNDNLVKTKDYINNTTNTLNSTIKENQNSIDKVDMLLSNKINKNSTDISVNSNNITTLKNNLGLITNVVNNNNSNIVNYDKNLKQYIEFKNNNTTINDALYNHRFEVVPNLSMNFLRNITAISGMTVKTNNTTNTMRICDNNVDNTNCIDMNINNGSFDIYPSAINSNNINNINIYSKNKNKVLANFNLANNNIYLGGANEDAALFINDSNVYVKNLNFLIKNGTYNSSKQFFNKDSNNLNQNYNIYSYDINDIVRLNQLSYSITGIYTIIKDSSGGANTIVFNFKSIYDILAGKKIEIDIPELGNIITTDIDIVNTELSSSSFIPKGVLNRTKIIFTPTTLIRANTNIRIKLIEPNLTLSSNFTDNDNYISNTISTIVI
jgi:hypothetical protein